MFSQRQPKLKRVRIDAFCFAASWPLPLGFRRFGLNRIRDLTSSSKTHAGSRGPSELKRGPKVLPSPVWTTLLGFIKDRPSASTDTACPLPDEPRPALRPGVAKLRTCSALAVLPDFGGLLHAAPCRFVAPCIRPWGSPRFQLAPLVARRLGVGTRLSRWRHTLRSFPLRVGRRASPPADPLSSLLPVSGGGSARVATFGPASVRRSPDLRVLLYCEVRCRPVGVATAKSPDAPLGFCPTRSSTSLPPPVRGSAARLPPLGSEDLGGLAGESVAPPPARRQMAGGRSVAPPPARRQMAGRPAGKPYEPGPRGAFGPVRPLRGRAPKGLPLQSTRWPPEGGCAVGAAICLGPRAWAGRGRARDARGRLPGWLGCFPEGRRLRPRPAVETPRCCAVAAGPKVGGARRAPWSWLPIERPPRCSAPEGAELRFGRPERNHWPQFPTPEGARPRSWWPRRDPIP
jgi:hypothetical protein